MSKRASEYPNLEDELKEQEAEYYLGSLVCAGTVVKAPSQSSLYVPSFGGSQFLYGNANPFRGPFSRSYESVAPQMTITNRGELDQSKQDSSESHNLIEGQSDFGMRASQVGVQAAEKDKSTFRVGEELVTKGERHELTLYRKTDPQGDYVSMRLMMLEEMFLEAVKIQDLRLRYFVEKHEHKSHAFRQLLIVRIQVYIKESIFDQQYKRELDENEAEITRLKEKAKELRKANKDKKNEKVKVQIAGLESEATQLQAQNNLSIAQRQLIIKLMRMVGTRVDIEALIKPQFTKDLTTRMILLKERHCHEEIKWNRKGFNFEQTFDSYCNNKCGKHPVVRYIRNIRELRELRHHSRRPGSFKRVLCSPEVYPHLTEQQQLETLQLQYIIDKGNHQTSELITQLVVSILTNEQEDIDLTLLKDNPEIAQQLQREIQQEEEKLDKSMEVKRNIKLGSYEGLTTLMFFMKAVNSSPDAKRVKERRLMSKILSRKRNKELFDEFQQQIMHIREYPTPEKISTRLLSHQAQALTWMMYRQQNLSPKFVLREDYKGGSIPKDRLLSAYWEGIRLFNGKYLYVNYFTGEFSCKPTQSKQVRGGILAYDMGLGKTITALSLIYGDQRNTFYKEKEGVLTGKNLYVTITAVLPNQIESLVRKHVHEPLNYIIIDRDNRKQQRDLSRYDIVFTSYETLKSEYKEFQHYGYTNKDEQEQCKQEDEEDDLATYIKMEHIDFPTEPPPARQKVPLHRGKPTLFGYYWNRIILDEAHHIRNRDTLASESTCALRGWSRWCLTGTPVQNNKTQMYALLKFLRVQIFSEWKWWNRYIERSESLQDGFATLHKILRRIMLTKSKSARNLQGQAILELPGKQERLISVDFSEEEACAYEMMRDITENFILKLIEKRQQKKQDKTSEEKKQSRKDTCSVFTLIMRLRQFCDDPCLAIPDFSRKKTQQGLRKALEDKLEKDLKDGISDKDLAEEQLCSKCHLEEEDLAPLRCGIHKVCKDCSLFGEERDLDCSICSRPMAFMPAFVPRVDVRDDGQTSTVYARSIAAAILPRPPALPALAEAESAEEMEDEPSEEYYSRKLLKVIGLALEIVQRGQKLIIFSQWIKVMERIAKELDWHSIRVICLNSNLKIPERRELMSHFVEGGVQVLVTSLKTSGEGLNLSIASSVIIVDPDWNPTIEQQGIDRAHRFGQEREVSIYRMVTTNSIEQKIRELHEKKIHERDYTMMDRRFFQGKKYIDKMLSLVSRRA